MRSDGNLVVGGGGGGGHVGWRVADLLGSPLPQPDVVEDDSEAGWSLWDEVVESQWPAPIGAILSRNEPDHAAAPIEGPLSLDAVLALARKNNRVCPMPGQWLVLYDVLTIDGARKLGPFAPRPLCGRAWTSSSAIAKRLRMRDQIVWTADYGGLRAVYDFLWGLKEEDWLHFGE